VNEEAKDRRNNIKGLTAKYIRKSEQQQ